MAWLNVSRRVSQAFCWSSSADFSLSGKPGVPAATCRPYSEAVAASDADWTASAAVWGAGSSTVRAGSNLAVAVGHCAAKVTAHADMDAHSNGRDAAASADSAANDFAACMSAVTGEPGCVAPVAAGAGVVAMEGVPVGVVPTVALGSGGDGNESAAIWSSLTERAHVRSESCVPPWVAAASKASRRVATASSPADNALLWEGGAGSGQGGAAHPDADAKRIPPTNTRLLNTGRILLVGSAGDARVDSAEQLQVTTGGFMNEQAIAALVEPLVARSGLEVDRIEVIRAGKRSVLRVYLDGDGPDGHGPSLDEIADATRAISIALDDSPAVGQAPYTLEVSTRGVSRPLTEMKHFRRNVGRLVNLTTAAGQVSGRILAVDGDAVALDVDNATRAVQLDEISNAVVVAELRKDALVADTDEEE